MKALPSINIPLCQALEHSSEIDSLPYIDTDITQNELKMAKKMIKSFRKQQEKEESFELDIQIPELDSSVIDKLLSESGNKGKNLGKRNWEKFNNEVLNMQESRTE